MNREMPAKILIATGNAGKIREFAGLFADLPFAVVGLEDFPHIEEVAETGATFAENACLKAAGYARQTGLWTLADDSGLEVEALKNAPGVFSARYAGKDASDADNVEKLLKELKKTGNSEKKARFVCAIAFSAPDGEIIHVENGTCDGGIADKPFGNKGFGYDPIFLPGGCAETFGELKENIKQQISHRARASGKILRFLRDFFAFSLDRDRFRE